MIVELEVQGKDFNWIAPEIREGLEAGESFWFYDNQALATVDSDAVEVTTTHGNTLRLFPKDTKTIGICYSGARNALRHRNNVVGALAELIGLFANGRPTTKAKNAKVVVYKTTAPYVSWYETLERVKDIVDYTGFCRRQVNRKVWAIATKEKAEEVWGVTGHKRYCLQEASDRQKFVWVDDPDAYIYEGKIL